MWDRNQMAARAAQELLVDAPPREALQPSRLEEVFHVPFHWNENSQGRVFLTYGR